MRRTLTGMTACVLGLAILGACVRPASAQASLACSAINDANGLAGKACQLLGSAKNAASATKKLLSGHVGSAVKSFKSILTGSSGTAAAASTALGLTAIVAWVVAGAKFSLSEISKVMAKTTTPQLTTSWFSATYWRIAGIGAVLTLPFLFAAATQALLRSDLALLTRAVLGYLPLSMLAVGLAAPLTTLLLAATDELCQVVSSAGGGGLHLDLGRLIFAGAAFAKGPFLVFLLGTITTMAALALWLELAIREAAVYVIVLMLPLAFAAMVWPSRRVWAVRAVELLVALILAKFAIVAVLVLGGATLDGMNHLGTSGIAAGLTGTVLVLMATLSPWAVLRLLPMSELASTAVGSLRPGLRGELHKAGEMQSGTKERIAELAEAITTQMRRQAQDAELSQDGRARVHDVARRADGGAPGRGDGTPDRGHGAPDGTYGAPDRGPGAPSVNGAGAAWSEAPTQAERPEGSGTTAERIPGMPARFQSEDLSWEPLTLGADADWITSSAPRQDDGEDAAPTGRREAADQGAEDYDPLPPRQDSDEGRL